MCFYRTVSPLLPEIEKDSAMAGNPPLLGDISCGGALEQASFLIPTLALAQAATLRPTLT